VFLIAASVAQALLGDGRFALAHRVPAFNLQLGQPAVSS
jgi:hypothetical protein